MSPTSRLGVLVLLMGPLCLSPEVLHGVLLGRVVPTHCFLSLAPYSALSTLGKRSWESWGQGGVREWWPSIVTPINSMHLGPKILQIFLQVIALQSLEGTGIHLHCFGMEDHLNGHKVRKNFREGSLIRTHAWCWGRSPAVLKLAFLEKKKYIFVQFSSDQSCPTLCDPMDCSTPGFPVHHQLLEFTQTHAH